MEKQDKKNYAEALMKAYDENLFEIIWTVSGCSIAVDNQKKDKFRELENEGFIDYAFHIFRIVSGIAEGRKQDEIKDSDLEIAKQIYEKEYDLRNHLYVKRNSKIDCFKYLEYDIISHKRVMSPQEQEISAAVVRLRIDKENKEEETVFELTKRDLKALLSKLNEINDKLQS